MSRFRQLLVRAFEEETSRIYLPVNQAVSLVILASVLVVILESVPSLREAYGGLFRAAEAFFLLFFLVEYLMRIYAAKDKRGYVTSAFGIIDLVSLLPSLLGFAFAGSSGPLLLWVVRLLRIMRLLRTIRLVRYVAPTKAARSRIGRFFREVQWLNIEIYLFALVIVVTFSATLMFAAEGSIPGTHFPTIPDAMWWAVVTITTVGYGDMVPLTVAGKLIASATMIAGLALFALMLVVVGQATQRALFGSSVNDPGR